MPVSQKKVSQGRNKTLQAKLSDFTKSRASKDPSASGGAMDSGEASASGTPEVNAPDRSKDMAAGVSCPTSAIILTTINNMKTEFSTRFDDILSAIESVRKDITDCIERVTEAETRISTTEDNVASLQTKVQVLENKNKDLEDTLLDLETRSRCSNLRMVNLPEGAEGEDACAFLESWLPDALELPPGRTKLTVERAHRVGPRNHNNPAPRTLIMKFLSFKDKEVVMRAAKSKREVRYKNQTVRFYQDVAAGVHKKQKEFDEARRQLRAMGLRYGIIPPARLIVTYKERSLIFNNHVEAEGFIQRIKSKEGSD
ncbi:unnamed protein product [Oreochromis niloticus]|nr:unnamed protein product [Mustela putorius furo]